MVCGASWAPLILFMGLSSIYAVVTWMLLEKMGLLKIAKRAETQII